MGLQGDKPYVPFIVVQKKPIIKIADNAFYRTNITEIILDDWNNVNKMERLIYFILCWEKYNDINLGSNLLVNIFKILPVQLETIGEKAFAYSGLTKITIPNSVTIIGKMAFAYSGLKKITIPGSIKIINEGMFQVCKRLKEVIIEDGVTTIPDKTFWYCESLSEITIPNSVTTIGKEAFGYSGLTKITIPNSVTTIQYNAFYYCKSLSAASKKRIMDMGYPEDQF